MVASGSFLPGDVVETAFGVGVVSESPNTCKSDDHEQQTYQVLLWRLPGKSIASTSVAYLQPNMILKKLPAAPGMITYASLEDDKRRRCMVQAYYSDKKLYRIIPLPEDAAKQENSDATNSSDHLQSPSKRLSRLSIVSPVKMDVNDAESSAETADEVTPEQLELAPSATFYPLICQLMKRGDEAAHATKDFLQTEQVSQAMEKASELAKNKGDQAMAAIDKAGSSLSKSTGDAPEDAIAERFKSAAEAEQVQQLLEMLKTEELTALLRKGKARLEQLLEDDIPQATKTALEKNGIQIADDDNDEDSASESASNYKKAMVRSRKAALQAMQKVLEDQASIDPNDLQAIQQSLTDNFGTMLDSWQEAAKSDRNLSSLLETVNEQTAAWQEATGRLLNTRSASIFLDGASRIHARARTLFSKDQLQWAGEIGAKFTKAFTEGDAAVARLKSIELGDQVRDRLITAIETRSESLGGLDGIIAGALTTVKDMRGSAEGKMGGDQMKDMLTNLQSRASNMTQDANETLISVLAKQSEYRDVALIKVEQVFCDLKSQFGDDLSPEDLAAIANGDGGTAKLFEPIAQRAAKEIDKQLTVAESSVSDPTMLGVLQHVRKIMSGDLSMGVVLDEVVDILNDDNVVAAGENLVKHGEQVLDALEGVNANKVVGDVMNIAEKAGITKDTVMERIESLDVNELLDNAGNAMTDESARRKLLSDATDTALDFILKVLPSMPVPPVDGVKDGLVYHISNLSMEGFKVRKENILVEIAGMRATKKQHSTKIQELDDSERPVSVPTFASTGSDDTTSQAGISSQGSFDSQGMDFDTSVDDNVVVKATELLIIDVSEISALMNSVEWSFEQTYMPYLKGSGKFDVKMSRGAIRLVFELRKRQKEVTDEIGEKSTVWEPVLCLHDRSCSIGSVDFNMQGGSRVAWVINKVAAVFKNLLRDYVVRTIMRILTDKSGWILSKLNVGLSPFWGVLLRTAKLEMGDLEMATQKDIIEATPVPKSALVELVWRERLPLGMNLLLNDESGQLKVVDFPRGSQARSVCEKKHLEPEGFKGATIVAVNGIKYQTEDELFEALRDPGRPKTIQFELAESEESERIRKFVEESQGPDEKMPSKPKGSAKDRVFATRNVVFTDPMDLGIEFANSQDNCGLVVRKFLETKDGLVLAAERRRNEIHLGDLLTHINGTVVLGENGSGRAKALKLLEVKGGDRPLSLTFAVPYLHRLVYEKSPNLPYVIGGPEEVLLKEDKEAKKIVLDGFKDVDGSSEKAGVMLGDYLVFLNGLSVGAGCRWMGESQSPPLSQIDEMMMDAGNYPIGLTFARPAQQQEGGQDRWATQLLGSGPQKAISMETSETTCVTAEYYDQLGLELEQKEYNDVVVKDLTAIAGPFQMTTEKLRDPLTEAFNHLSVDSINGEFVPSFATTQMVRSAMERSWKSHDRVDVIYCDNDRKKFVHSLSDQE